jgi:hypothetical protein
MPTAEKILHAKPERKKSFDIQIASSRQRFVDGLQGGHYGAPASVLY